MEYYPAIFTDVFEEATRLLKIYYRKLGKKDFKKTPDGLQLPPVNTEGTGFFLEKNVGIYAPVSKLFLVSNKHVLARAKEIWFQPHVVPGTKPISYVSLGEFQIVCHSDPNVDLAVIDVTAKMRELRALYPNIIINPISYDLIPKIANDLNTLPGGTNIVYLGYTDGQVDGNNVPSRGDGKLSQAGRHNWDGKPQFRVATTPTISPGASGSPTFGNIRNQTKLLGIATEAEVQHINQQGISSKYSYGHVLKITALKELIDSFG